jgi:hypothetical protein
VSKKLNAVPFRNSWGSQDFQFVCIHKVQTIYFQGWTCSMLSRPFFPPFFLWMDHYFGREGSVTNDYQRLLRCNPTCRVERGSSPEF